MMMKIEYDPEVDALYIEFRPVPPTDSIDIGEGVIVDLDAENHIVGLEILDASEKLRGHMQRIELNGLPLCELPLNWRPESATIDREAMPDVK